MGALCWCGGPKTPHVAVLARGSRSSWVNIADEGNQPEALAMQQRDNRVLGRDVRSPLGADQLDAVPWSHGNTDATVEFTTSELTDHRTARLLRTEVELPSAGVLDRVQILEALPVGL